MPIGRVNGIDIYYEDEGEGTPVLFIHGGFGGAESALYWKPSAFKGVLPLDQYRVVTYDRRGGGRSTFVEGHYTLDDIVMDARELLRHLRIERAIIVGDSLGGVIAQKLALTHPEAVQSLLLVETTSRLLQVDRKTKALIAAARIVPLRPLFPLFRKRALSPEFYHPLGPLTADEVAERFRHHQEYTARLQTLSAGELYRYTMGLLRNYAAFVDTDLTEEVRRLTMPIAIMHGTTDNVIRFASAVVMHGSMPHAQFHSLPGLGHGLFYYPEARELARQIIEKQASQWRVPVTTSAAD